MLDGVSIKQRVEKHIELNKIPEKVRKSIAILKSFNLWDIIHNNLYFISQNEIVIDCECKLEFLTIIDEFLTVDILYTIKDYLFAYIEYIFSLEVSDSLGITVKYDRSCIEALNNNFTEYMLCLDLAYTKTNIVYEQKKTLKNIYKVIFDKSLDDNEINLFIENANNKKLSLLEWLRKYKPEVVKYIDELISNNCLTKDITFLCKWQQAKKKLNELKRYGFCAICGNKFKKLRKEQFLCGQKENGWKCKKRFYYLLKQAKNIKEETLEEIRKTKPNADAKEIKRELAKKLNGRVLMAKLQEIYNTKAKGNKPNIFNWGKVVNEIMKRL